MRPNHQNKRMRGRNRGGGGSGGGRAPNPLTRSYESNGPDVKVRGTAQSIAEKYLQLGRDAQAVGDYITAESFFQHAEHYLRLIAAAQEQYQLQNPGYRGFDTPEGAPDENEEEAAPFNQGHPQPEFRPPFRPQSDQEGMDETRQSYSEQDQREFGARDPQGRLLRDQRPFPPREQRDHRPRSRDQRGFQTRDHRDYQQRDGQHREHTSRFNQPTDLSEQNAREHYPRDPRRQSEQRRNETRHDGRRDREAAPIPAHTEQPALPSFITAPVRVPMAGEAESSALPLQNTGSVVPDMVKPVGVKRRGRPPKARAAEEMPSE